MRPDLIDHASRQSALTLAEILANLIFASWTH